MPILRPFVAVLGFAGGLCAGPAYEASFDFHRNQIVIRVRANGSGHYHFVLETGTRSSPVDINSAERPGSPQRHRRRGGLVSCAPDDFRISITNAAGENSYPVASYTWLLTPARIEDPGKRRTITEFLRWMLAEGQRMAEPLGYAPLPLSVAAEALKAVQRIH